MPCQISLVRKRKDEKRMRTKKHVLSLLMALAMVLSLAACGGSDNNTTNNDNPSDKPSIAGTYHLTKVNAGGVNMDVAQVSEQTGIEVKVPLILKEDGTFSLDMSSLGTGESVSGTWKEDGSNAILTAEGQDIPATIDGKTLSMEQNGQSLTFEKE